VGKARQLLQQALDTLSGQPAVAETKGDGETEQQVSQPSAEDGKLPFEQGTEEKIDPRFAELLKPRQEKGASESLRGPLHGQETDRNSVQTPAPTADHAAQAAAVKSEQGQAEIADLLNSDPKQLAENLLRQVPGTQHSVLPQNGELNTLKQTPLEGRMLNLPSGQQVAESQVFDQVVARMSGSFNGQSGRMVLRMHPAELGSLRLDLKVEGDRIHANLHTQSQQVQEVLERNLPQLRNALAEQGLKIDQFQVNVDQHHQQQSQSDHLAQQHHQGARQQKNWQSGWQQEEQIIPLGHLMQNGGGGISLHV